MRISKNYKKKKGQRKHDASTAARGFHVSSHLPAAKDPPQRWVHIKHIVMQTNQYSCNSQLKNVRSWKTVLDSINLLRPSNHPLRAATTWMNATFLPIATDSSQLLIKVRGLRGRDAPPHLHWQSGRCQASQTNGCSKSTGRPSAVLDGKAEGKQMYFSRWTRRSMTWTNRQGKLMRAIYGFLHPTAQMIRWEGKKGVASKK